jgi:cell division protease FtsH
LIDSEVRKIVDECYQKALTQITQNRDKLEALAKALLDRETLDEADAYAVAGFPRPPRPELLDSAIPDASDATKIPDASDATKGAPAASA